MAQSDIVASDSTPVPNQQKVPSAISIIRYHHLNNFSRQFGAEGVFNYYLSESVRIVFIEDVA